MAENVKSLDAIFKLQGDLVLVFKGEQEMLLTFIHVKDVLGSSLRIVNKQDKSRKPDWPVTQAILDALKPAPPHKANAKWTLRLKG